MTAEIDPAHGEKRIHKMCPVVLRRTPEGLQFLAFRHPEDNNQVVVGATGADETPAKAAARLLLDKSGLKAGKNFLDLGKSNGIVQGESWQFILFNTAPLADEWTNKSSSDNSLTFFWQSFDAFLEDGWDAPTIRAIRHVQLKLENVPAEKLETLIPASNTEISNKILAMLKMEQSVDPTQVARAIAGKDEKQWRKLMKPIRAEAIRLAKQGQATILRKGKIADPDAFKGVYRIGRAN